MPDQSSPQHTSAERVAAPASDPVVRGGFILVVFLTLVFAIAGAVIRPSMYSDSAFGFRIWDSMRDGAGFNRLIYPDEADITRDKTNFETTWTPAQYIFPGVLEWTGLDIGLAISLVVTIASALGLWGWYTLYRAFGFSARTSTLSLLFVVCGRHFGLPFGIYNGGEVLLFGAAPWAILVVWRLRELRWYAVPAVIAATTGLVFLKLSGIVFMGAAVSAVVLSSGQPWFSRETVRKSIVAALTLMLCAGLFYWAWLHRGWSVVNGATHTDWSQLGTASAFTISNIWSCIFGFGSLIQYVLFFPGRPQLLSGTTVNYVMLLPALATATFMWLRLRTQYGTYVRFALLASAAVAVFFAVLWLHGGEVDMAERHFRPISLMLVVGMFEAFLGSRSLFVRVAFVIVAGLAMIYGIGSYVQHARTNLNDPLGMRGARLHIVTPQALAYVRSIDKVDGDGDRPIIYIPTPEIGLELHHARIIAAHANFESKEILASRVYRGKVRRLYVLLQATLVDNGKAEVILRSFPDYPADGWKKTALGDFVVFSSTP